MAFTGAAVVTSLGNRIVRITGIALNGNTTGTIGVQGSGANVLLPSNFPSLVPDGLTLADIVELRYTIGVIGGPEQNAIHVDKQASPLLFTLTNDAGQATGGLEIYVQAFHTLIS